MRRKLFNLAVVISQLLLVALLGAWIAYFNVKAGFVRESSNANAHTSRVDWFLVVRGKFAWSMSLWDPSTVADRTFARYKRYYLPERDRPRPLLAWNDESLHFLRFELSSGTTAGGDNQWREIAVPCWFLAATLLILPTSHARFTYVRSKRLRAGRCPICGYDLRATPQGRRCPECGASAPATAAAAP